MTGTSVVSDSAGNQLSAISYYPYGDRWESQGQMPTDKLFTGQRLDSTGLYYYGARYYDPVIGRFISADTVVQSLANPQTLNRYSYVLNNPLKFTDPTGLNVYIGGTDISDVEDIVNQIIDYEEWGMEAPDYLIEQLLALTSGFGENDYDTWNEWEKLEREEADYTRHMEDSDITFDIVDVDARSKTVSFNVDLPLISFDEPVQLSFVNSFQMLTIMPPFIPPGASLYPDPIFINTDYHYSPEYFTWSVAHESYHRWEQSLYVDESVWYRTYLGEAIHYPLARDHGKRASEIRANKYANRYYPY